MFYQFPFVLRGMFYCRDDVTVVGEEESEELSTRRTMHHHQHQSNTSYMMSSSPLGMVTGIRIFEYPNGHKYSIICESIHFGEEKKRWAYLNEKALSTIKWSM